MKQPVIAVDIGNSRVKFARFNARHVDRHLGGLPRLEQELVIRGNAAHACESFDRLHRLFDDGPQSKSRTYEWRIAHVNNKPLALLLDWIKTNRPDDSVRLLDNMQLGLTIQCDPPGQVGIDRLLNAVAADHMLEHDTTSIIVDAGTAITIDLLTPVRVFRGGVILPGLELHARSLAQYTDRLPLVSTKYDIMTEVPPFGITTETAIRSGIYWGTVGAICQIIHEMVKTVSAPCQIYFTGGDSELLFLPCTDQCEAMSMTHIPDLTMLGIAAIDFD